MLCVRLSFNTLTIYCARVIIRKIKMPKYAVAVGRKVGVYDTWDECKAQIAHFPKARCQKFDSLQEAEDFIRSVSNTKESTSTMCEETEFSRPENTNRPELIKVEKVSPSSDLFSLSNRVRLIEERLSKYISETSSTIEKLVKRVEYLESRSSSTEACVEPPLKKIRTDSPLVDNLTKNDCGFVTVYTDGACSNNGRTGAQAGIGVWFNDNHPLNISAPVQGPATNNNAEIQAARVAITQAHFAGVRKLSIFTDSKFVINCITEWINKWKKNDWQLSTGGPVKNKDELIKLDDAIQLLEAVEWNYVPGHKGNKGNEMADKLARKGASNYKSNITYSRQANLENVKFFNAPDCEF